MNACFQEKELKAFLEKHAGNIVTHGSKNPDHIRDNVALFDFASLAKTINGGIIAWENSFRIAPIATVIVTAFATLKFTKPGKLLTGKLCFQDKYSCRV